MIADRPSPAPHGADSPIRFDGIRARAIETARNRLLVIGIVFLMAFVVVAGRLVDLSLFADDATQRAAGASADHQRRGDIVDRRGIMLASSLPIASLFADPQEVLDPEGTADGLLAVFPALSREQILAKLLRDGRFVWLCRNLSPEQQYAINRLGLPGLGFEQEYRRVYPQGTAAAHVLGFTDIDGNGLAGVERWFDQSLSRGDRLRLSIDLRVQQFVREELTIAIEEFRGIGGGGLVLDVNSGEVLAMVSMPDFDPNRPAVADSDARFNRVAQGVFEMGSTFKLFTAAMALDSGTTSLQGGYDASRPIRVARFTIEDYKGQHRWLSLPEILVYSSNIGAAYMALDVGGGAQRKYLDGLGLLKASPVELPEVGAPLTPGRWRDINVMTIGFGHGIAVSPLNLASGVATVVNGGIHRPATLRFRGGTPAEERPVLSLETSEQMRALMRLIVVRGTGKKADAAGLRVGGKTGTAEKLSSGRYRGDSRLSSFVGAFPMDEPRYVVLAFVDEPKGNAKTHNYATGGWVAAPVVGRIIERIAPLLGVEPIYDGGSRPGDRRATTPEKPILVAVREAIAEARGRRIAAR